MTLEFDALDSIAGRGLTFGQGVALTSRGCHRSRRICSISRTRSPHVRRCCATDCGPASGISAPPPRRVALTFTAVVLAACVVAAALLFSRAQNEQQAIRDRALSTAIALSFGFDQEVAAGNALLKGLSSSPALRAGDIKSFYDQLKATPIPDGSWLILQDLDGQVVNTLRPFGAALPRASGFPDLSRSAEPGPGARVDRVGPHGEPREARNNDHRAQPSDQP